MCTHRDDGITSILNITQQKNQSIRAALDAAHQKILSCASASHVFHNIYSTVDTTQTSFHICMIFWTRHFGYTEFLYTVYCILLNNLRVFVSWNTNKLSKLYRPNRFGIFPRQCVFIHSKTLNRMNELWKCVRFWLDECVRMLLWLQTCWVITGVHFMLCDVPVMEECDGGWWWWCGKSFFVNVKPNTWRVRFANIVSVFVCVIQIL